MSPRVALLTAAFATVLAIAAALSPVAVFIVGLALAIILAQGWARLLRLPVNAAIGPVVCAAGVGLLLGAFLPTTTGFRLTGTGAMDTGTVSTLLVSILATALVIGFVANMFRNPRPRLVATMSGLVTGVILALGLTGWVLAVRLALHLRPLVELALVLAALALVGALLMRSNRRGLASVPTLAPVTAETPMVSDTAAPAYLAPEPISARAPMAAAAAIVAAAGPFALAVTQLLAR